MGDDFVKRYWTKNGIQFNVTGIVSSARAKPNL
jgi:hypothetical protein